MSLVKHTSLSTLVGGEAAVVRKIGDNVTTTDLLALYRKNPSAKLGVVKLIRSMFHNGFSEDFPTDKKLELMKAVEYAYLFGYALLITDNDSVEAWNPHTGGIGFTMTEFDEDGELVTVRIQRNTQEDPDPWIIVTNDPSNKDYVEGRELFVIRNSDGLPGVRGESKLLSLADVLSAGFDLYNLYLKYALAQSMNILDVPVENYTDDDETLIRPQVESAMTSDTAIIHDARAQIEFKNPMGNNYDPSNILEKTDQYISRVTQLNKSMLTGTPEGHLSSSKVALMAWNSYVKEEQDLILPELLDVFEALGFTRDILFNDPEEFTRDMQYMSIKIMREAFDGIISKDDQLKEINMLLGTDYKLVKEEEIENDRGNGEPGDGEPGSGDTNEPEPETPEDGTAPN